MALQVNGLNIVQNNSKPQMNMTFKANSVATTNTLERTPTTDTLQTKSKKKGLSTGAKWGLGTLALAGIGTAVYFATRGKVGAKQAQQFAEHIEFKPAKTVEEAKKFAQEKLGVHYYEIDDVDMINYINEWLTISYNKAKGKITVETYPKFFGNMTDELSASFGHYDGKIKDFGTEGYLMGVNMNSFKHFDKFLDEVLDYNHKQINLDMFDSRKNHSLVKDFVKRVKNFNNTTATFDEKIKIYQDYYKIRDGRFVDGEFIPAEISKFRDLWHELGHMKHQICSPNYNQMQKVEEFLEQGLPVPKITQEFVDNTVTQKTVKEVSEYASESPLEFVAETFAGLLEGKTYSDDVMALYKKYGGPALS